MQFLLIAYDATDDHAHERRRLARPQHLSEGQQLIQEGHALYGTAILNPAGQMIGSMLVLDFPTRTGLDTWLKTEPYIRDHVWEQITIQPCQVGAAFMPSHDPRKGIL